MKVTRILSTHYYQRKAVCHEGDKQLSPLFQRLQSDSCVASYLPEVDDLDNYKFPIYREAKALQRLKAHGLSGNGYVPRFHGMIKKLDPKSVLPGLLDPTAAYAVLLEYIPDIQQLNTTTYTKEH